MIRMLEEMFEYKNNLEKEIDKLRKIVDELEKLRDEFKTIGDEYRQVLNAERNEFKKIQQKADELLEQIGGR